MILLRETGTPFGERSPQPAVDIGVFSTVEDGLAAVADRVIGYYRYYEWIDVETGEIHSQRKGA